MVEDAASKWVRVADRGGKRGSGYKGNHKGEGEMARYQTERSENKRFHEQTSVGPGRAGEQQHRVCLQEDTREEGEITTVGMIICCLRRRASKTSWRQHKRRAQRWCRTQLMRRKGFNNYKDDLPDLSAEEIAEMNLLLETEATDTKTEELQVQAGGKGPLLEAEAKKETTKKKPLKPPTSTAASNKLRIAKALASPRKRAPAKEVVSVVGGGLISSMNISWSLWIFRKSVVGFRMVTSYGFVGSFIVFAIIMNKLHFWSSGWNGTFLWLCSGTITVTHKNNGY
ncbi:Uncharacterized protein Rs2_37497 [Raphanus sativus]|nr:Uncharacterized protein Rs2_37497 [Raphanus sativus]